MGTGDIYYDTSSRDYRFNRFRTEYGDIIPANTFDEYSFDPDSFFPTERKVDRIEYEDRAKKFDEILYDVLLDFAGSGIKLICPNNPYLYIESSKSVIENIVIEGNSKKTKLVYDPTTHEISGFVWMSLGDRDLTEITEEEVGIIRRALLIWIYENI
jgi:hypothetical protein